MVRGGSGLLPSVAKFIQVAILPLRCGRFVPCASTRKPIMRLRDSAAQHAQDHKIAHMPVSTKRLLGLIPKGGRLLRIVWPLLAVVVLLVLLAAASIEILSSVRAYVSGEGMWSKAQKESVYYLIRYAGSRSEADYRRYLEAVAVPLGDRRAREELEKPYPDLAIARQGFLDGRNHPPISLG
jgi:hypothetical protein